MTDTTNGQNVHADSIPQKTKASAASRRIRMILGVLCLCVAIGCMWYLGKYYLESKKSQDNIDVLRDMIVADDIPPEQSDVNAETAFTTVNGRSVQTKYAALYEANPDFIGWVTIPDTKVDYPVMQHDGENEYYINRNFEQEWDGSGLPFLDLNCSFTEPTANQLIYGHNMKSGTMFAGILNYRSEDFYKEHQTFSFNTIDGDGEYEVIAAFSSQIYPEDDTEHFKYYQFFDTDSQEEFDAFVKQVKALTPYEIDATAHYGDSLVTLSTCAYHTEDGRFAVVAKKVK